MLLELGLAVGGGLLNALGGESERKEVEKRKQQALAMLRENIIDPAELDDMLKGINQMFNSRLVSTLNTTALRSRGVANSGVVKGVVAGQIEGQRLGSLSETRFRAQESNRTTYGQMAGVEQTMGSSGSFLGDFAEGAMQALPIGMELSKMMSPEIANTLNEGGNLIDAEGLDDSGMFDSLGDAKISTPGYDESNIMGGLDTFTKLWGKK